MGTDSEHRELVNAHDAMTLFYSLLMAAAVREAMVGVFQTQSGVGRAFGGLDAEALAVFVVFLLVVARFFLGNVRHMDASYVEPVFGGRVSPERTAPQNRFFDFAWILVQAVVFFYLGSLVTRPRQFFALFTVLLALDALWLLFSSLRLGKVREGSGLSSEIRWALNNGVHAILFAILFASTSATSPGQSVLAFVLLGVSNSVLDVSLTWDEYFPPVPTGREPGSE